jgi:two-component system sensor histidine kinase PilS (NtrC family)
MNKPAPPAEKSMRRLRWLIISRIAIATFLLAIYIFIDLKQTFFHTGIEFPPFYSLILITYIISFILIFLLKVVKNYKVHAYIQMTCDVLLITFLVHITGGVSSVYSVLYPMVIIYTVLFAERKGGFIVATACSLSYGLLLNLEFYGISYYQYQLGLPEVPEGAGYIYSRISIHALSFFMVAFLASFVIEQEKATRTLLAEKESAFDRLDLLHRSIIESIDTGILTVDLDGRVTSFNRAAVNITGLTAAEVLNKDIMSVFPDFNTILERFTRAPAGRGPERRMEMTIRNRERGEQILGCSLSQLKGNNDERLGNILIFQDLTAIKKIEADYEKSRRLAFIGEMAAGLAHEIRNPLAAIGGSIQMLKKDLKLDPTDERLMKIVLRGKDQLESFMKDFLLLARPAAADREWIDLNGLIDEILESLVYIPDWTGDVAIEKKMPEPAMIYANKVEMQHVIWNLVINALQAMPGGGRLNIETTSNAAGSSKSSIQLLVEDSGEGIAKEDMSRMFEPFYTTKEKGTGLGMAVIGRIIENYSGTISIDSEKEKGTAIRVCLPSNGNMQEGGKNGNNPRR